MMSGNSSAERNKVLIEEEQVEVRSELLSDAILDENVNINLIRRFFSNDAWLLVEEVVALKHRTRSTCANTVHMM